MADGRPADVRNLLNPYEASHVVESQEDTATPVSGSPPRVYHLEMQWADRRRFLRSVGILRIAAVAGAVMGFYGLYGLMMAMYSAWQIGTLATWFEPMMAGRWLFTLFKGALGFYACWLQWSLAEAIAATAGGTTGRMVTWSDIQHRIALLAVVVLAAGALSLGWDWLTMRLMFAGFGK